MDETLTTPLIPPAEVTTADGRDDTAPRDGSDDLATAAIGRRDDLATGGGDGLKSRESKRGGPCDEAEALDPKHSSLPDDGAMPKDSPSTASAIEILREKSRRFADSASASSMATEAVSFFKAVEEFGTEKRTVKVTDTKLSETGRLLYDAASRAPPSEAALAATAINITDESLNILLSTEDGSSSCCDFWRRCPWLVRLRAAVSAPEPTLPLYRVQREEKLGDKRQALFGVALAAPVALLTSAAGTQVFPPAFVPWIVVISAVLWIAVSCGLVMDLYGKTELDFLLASCLSRLGMMGVTALFCLFIFGAFFPSATTMMWVMVVFAVALHAFLCVKSRMGDD